MSDLAQIQQHFQHFLLSAEGTIFGSTAIPVVCLNKELPTFRGSTAESRNLASSLDPAVEPRDVGPRELRKSSIFPFIAEAPPVSVEKRLSIYHDAYHYRLLEALQNNYPCLVAYIGSEQFNQYGLSYIKQHPSTYRSIRWFGDQFPAFLKATQRSAILAELAEFEWRMTLTFDAEDAPVYTIQEITSLPATAWETLQLQLHPSVQRICLYWNTTTLWQSLSNNKSIEEITLLNTPANWLIWRVDYINRFYQLAEDEATCLEKVAEGGTFASLCETLCDYLPETEVAMRAATLLKGWIEAGLITGISYEKD